MDLLLACCTATLLIVSEGCRWGPVYHSSKHRRTLTYIHTLIHTYTFLYTCICTHICTHTNVHSLTNTCNHVHTRTYTLTHTYTQQNKSPNKTSFINTIVQVDILSFNLLCWFSCGSIASTSSSLPIYQTSILFVAQWYVPSASAEHSDMLLFTSSIAHVSDKLVSLQVLQMAEAIDLFTPQGTGNLERKCSTGRWREQRLKLRQKMDG